MEKKNREVDKNLKYFLGLDLGVTSVGWAVMVEKDDEHFLHDFGVRIFKGPEKPQKETDAAQRRMFRSQRRIIRRRANRIKRLKKLLKDIGFLREQDFFANFQKRATNKIHKSTAGFETDAESWNPFLLRYQGLSQQLNKYKIYAVLIHFAKKRGYLDKFSFQEEEKEKDKKVKENNSKFNIALQTAEEMIKKHGTIATAVLHEKQFWIKQQITDGCFFLHTNNSKYLPHLRNEEDKKTEKSRYRFLFSREHYQTEFNKIFEQQGKFYPELKKHQKQIAEIIFDQRDFETGPKCRSHPKPCIRNQCSRYKPFTELVSTCPYHPTELRGFKASLLFVVFQFVGEISKFLAVIHKMGVILNKDEHRGLIEHFLNEKGNQNKKKKILEQFLKNTVSWKKHGDSSYFKNPMWRSKKEGMDLSDAEFLKAIRNVPYLKMEITRIMQTDNLVSNLETSFINNLGKIVSVNITPKRRKDAIWTFLRKQEAIGKDDQEAIEKCFNKLGKNAKKPAGVSFRHMKEYIGLFLAGELPFKKLLVKEKQFDKTKKPFAPFWDPDVEKNPVVWRAVNQTRKVLKALINRYKEFANINIELARDVAQSLKNWKKDRERQFEREKNNERAEKILEKMGWRINPTNRLAIKLWKQQEEQCLYCGIKIDIKIVPPSKNEVQIDHIVPISRYYDDSFDNKVLTHRMCNQEKGKRTPLEWLQNGRAKSFLAIIAQLKISKRKLIFLNARDVENNNDFKKFVSRNLNDTRYISKYFYNYIKSQINPKNTNILAIKGEVTSRLRTKWLDGTAWGLPIKPRDITPFHHAVDAIILTQFKDQNEVELGIDLVRLDKLKREWEDIKIKNPKTESDQEEAKSEYLNFEKLVKNKWAERESQFLKTISKVNDESFRAFYIKDLQNEVERRIPVVLKKVKCSETGKQIPQFKDLLDEKEWQKKQKGYPNNFGINLRYPLVSHMTNYKVKGSLTSSENFGFPKKKNKGKNEFYKIWKQDPELKNVANQEKIEQIMLSFSKEKEKEKQEQIRQKAGKKWKKWKKEFDDGEGFIEKESGNIIVTDKYYGVILDIKNKELKWLRRVDMKQNDRKKPIDMNKLLVPGVTIEYLDNKEGKIVNKTYRGKAGNSVHMHPNQIQYAPKQKSEKIKTKILANGEDTMENLNKILESTNLKILKIDILGNKTSC